VCYSLQIARWSKLWKLIQDGECEACSDLVIDPLRETDSNNPFDQKVKKFLMDRYTPYAGVAGMLLHINGKFRMGKLQSSLLS
jgi:hypothetical protein